MALIREGTTRQPTKPVLPRNWFLSSGQVCNFFFGGQSEVLLGRPPLDFSWSAYLCNSSLGNICSPLTHRTSIPPALPPLRPRARIHVSVTSRNFAASGTEYNWIL